MTRAKVKHLDQPDLVRELPLGRVELYELGGVTMGRLTFDPGWR